MFSYPRCSLWIVPPAFVDPKLQRDTVAGNIRRAIQKDIVKQLYNNENTSEWESSARDESS